MSEYLHLKSIGILILVLILASIYFAFFGKSKLKIAAQKVLFAVLFFILGLAVFLAIYCLLQIVYDVDELLTSFLIAIVCIYYSIRGYQVVCRKRYGKKETGTIENKGDSKDKGIG